MTPLNHPVHPGVCLFAIIRFASASSYSASAAASACCRFLCFAPLYSRCVERVNVATLVSQLVIPFAYTSVTFPSPSGSMASLPCFLPCFTKSPTLKACKQNRNPNLKQYQAPILSNWWPHSLVVTGVASSTPDHALLTSLHLTPVKNYTAGKNIKN